MEPRFEFVQGTTAWTPQSVVEFSMTSGSGATLETLTGSLDLSGSNLTTGPQLSLDWSAIYPVMQGDNSYEFIFGLRVISTTDNNIMGMRVWCPNYQAPPGCVFMIGTVPATGFTPPVSSISSIAVTNLETLDGTSDNFLYVGSPANYPGALSDPVYVQVQTNGLSQGGNQPVMPQLEISLYWN
jgi:hypothetical protein